MIIIIIILTSYWEGDDLTDDAPDTVPCNALVVAGVPPGDGLDLVEGFGGEVGDIISVL